MHLVASTTSPFSRKVRICFFEKKIPYTLNLDDGWDPDSRLFEINPLGKIPCLILPNGKSIFDSAVIVDYIDGLSSASRLIPDNNIERAYVKTFEALADGLLDAAILARRERISRPIGAQNQASIDRQMNKVEQALSHLSSAIGSSQYYHDNKFSLADIAVTCALDWLDFRLPKLTWKADHPNLNSYLANLTIRESIKLTDPRIKNNCKSVSN
jgi:glutathione S-transferase